MDAEREAIPFIVGDMVIRFTAILALIALAWLVLNTPRQRTRGVLVLAAGLYLSVGLVLSYVLRVELPFGEAPLGLQVLPSPGTVVAWLGTSMAVLGIVEIVRPTAGVASDGAATSRVEQRAIG